MIKMVDSAKSEKDFSHTWDKLEKENPIKYYLYEK